MVRDAAVMASRTRGLLLNRGDVGAGLLAAVVLPARSESASYVRGWSSSFLCLAPTGIGERTAFAPKQQVRSMPLFQSEVGPARAHGRGMVAPPGSGGSPRAGSPGAAAAEQARRMRLCSH